MVPASPSAQDAALRTVFGPIVPISSCGPPDCSGTGPTGTTGVTGATGTTGTTGAGLAYKIPTTTAPSST